MNNKTRTVGPGMAAPDALRRGSLTGSDLRVGNEPGQNQADATDSEFVLAQLSDEAWHAIRRCKDHLQSLPAATPLGTLLNSREDAYLLHMVAGTLIAEFDDRIKAAQATPPEPPGGGSATARVLVFPASSPAPRQWTVPA